MGPGLAPVDELRMGARPAAVELARPVLFLQMEVTGHRELGEEFGRRDVLRRPGIAPVSWTGSGFQIRPPADGA